MAFEVGWRLLCCKVLARCAFFSSPISGPCFDPLLKLCEVFQTHMSNDFLFMRCEILLQQLRKVFYKGLLLNPFWDLKISRSVNVSVVNASVQFLVVI